MQSDTDNSGRLYLQQKSPRWRQAGFDVSNVKDLKMTAARTHGKRPVDEAGSFAATTEPAAKPLRGKSVSSCLLRRGMDQLVKGLEFDARAGWHANRSASHSMLRENDRTVEMRI